MKRASEGLEYWLREILPLPTAPFHEEEVAARIRRFARERKLALREDRAGNLVMIYERGTRTGPGVAFTSHMDHPGFIIEADSRRKRATAICYGGVNVECAGGTRVRVFTSEKEVMARITKVQFGPKKRIRRVRLELDGYETKKAPLPQEWNYGWLFFDGVCIGGLPGLIPAAFNGQSHRESYTFELEPLGGGAAPVIRVPVARTQPSQPRPPVVSAAGSAPAHLEGTRIAVLPAQHIVVAAHDNLPIWLLRQDVDAAVCSWVEDPVEAAVGVEPAYVVARAPAQRDVVAPYDDLAVLLHHETGDRGARPWVEAVVSRGRRKTAGAVGCAGTGRPARPQGGHQQKHSQDHPTTPKQMPGARLVSSCLHSHAPLSCHLSSFASTGSMLEDRLRYAQGRPRTTALRLCSGQIPQDKRP